MLRSILFVLLAVPAAAQLPLGLGAASSFVNSETNGYLDLHGEIRGRYESRTGTTFGKDPDIETGLVRTRLSLTFHPWAWLKFSGMIQDARAPWYGKGAPSNLRDYVDLQEGYVELFGDRDSGAGFSAGRRMLNFGEARLIGSPQWTNVTRTWDHARAYYRWKRLRLEALLLSPVKVQIADFNRPVLGDRIWGTYNALPEIWHKTLLEAYVLRHDQNREGGFTGGSTRLGTDRLRVNSFGFRLAGPLVQGLSYSLEGVVQNGKIGPAEHTAGAWYSSVTRPFMVAGRKLETSIEYKYASGTANPSNAAKSGTFDQLYPANHDKFGHEDLFGWKNLHHIRGLASYSISKSFTLNAMYSEFWLASDRDALYNGQGKAIVRSAAGIAGRHVGREADLFATYSAGPWLFGGGYGHFVAGHFLVKTSPAVGPVYLYLFHTYSF